MTPPELGNELGKLAACHRRHGRSGRNVKSHHIAKQLHAAGQPRMTTGGVIAYPRGRKV